MALGSCRGWHVWHNLYPSCKACTKDLVLTPSDDLVLRRIQNAACRRVAATKRPRDTLAIFLQVAFQQAELRRAKKKRKKEEIKKARNKSKKGFPLVDKCNLEASCSANLGVAFCCSHTPAGSILDFKSFAARGRFLDGRVSEPSQVQ